MRYCQGLLYSFALESTVAIHCYAILSLEYKRERGQNVFSSAFTRDWLLSGQRLTLAQKFLKNLIFKTKIDCLKRSRNFLAYLWDCVTEKKATREEGRKGKYFRDNTI